MGFEVYFYDLRPAISTQSTRRIINPSTSTNPSQHFMMDGEQFLGGFGSGFLARGFIAGYGVYATNLRIFGIRDPTTISGGHLAGLVEGELMPKLSAEENLKVIEGLDAKKEFDMSKEQISRIELKRPGLLGTGHMAIIPKNGGELKISIRHRIGFERLRDVMQVFYPEALSLK